MVESTHQKFDRANEGSVDSTLPDKQISTQELHPRFSMRTKEDYTGLSLPHIVAKVCAHNFLPHYQPMPIIVYVDVVLN